MRGMAGRKREVAVDPLAAVGCTDTVAIGSGGASVVYRARQVAFDRLVALKVLNLPLEDERAQRRFQRELSLAGRLTGHPNVVTVFASGFLPDGRGFVQMEYCPGGSLADRLAGEGPLSVDRVVAVGIKLAGVLELARIQGIVHRDVKPANVLITRFGEPALSDFGIAVVSGEVTGTTQALTPVHAAPEVLESRVVGAAADQWSLGSTLHTLLAGRAPYASMEAEGLLAGMLRVLNDPVPAIPRTDVPASLRAVLERTMAKDPQARYRTAGDLGRALQAVEAEQGWPATRLPIEEVPEARGPWSDAASTGPETTTSPGTGGIWPARVTPAGPPPEGHTQQWSRHSGRQPGTRLPAIPPVMPPSVAPPPGAPRETAPNGGAATAGESTRHFSRRPALDPHPAFSPTAPVAPSRRTLYWGIGAGVVAVVVVVGLVVFLTRSPAKPTTKPGPVLQSPSAAANARYAPRNVTVSDEQPTTVTLHWTDPSNGSIPYVVQVSDGRTQVATSNDQAVVAGLDPGQGYCFVVLGVYGVGSRAAGSSVCIRGGTATPASGASSNGSPTTVGAPTAPTAP